MTDPVSIPASTATQANRSKGSGTGGGVGSQAGVNDEPLGAILVGALLGAIAFYLCALWLSVDVGIVSALVAAIATFARRELPAALTFVAASALSAAALLTSTTVLLFSALCFGAGLALTVRRGRDATLAARKG